MPINKSTWWHLIQANRSIDIYQFQKRLHIVVHAGEKQLKFIIGAAGGVGFTVETENKNPNDKSRLINIGSEGTIIYWRDIFKYNKRHDGNFMITAIILNTISLQISHRIIFCAWQKYHPYNKNINNTKQITPWKLYVELQQPIILVRILSLISKSQITILINIFTYTFVNK